MALFVIAPVRFPADNRKIGLRFLKWVRLPGKSKPRHLDLCFNLALGTKTGKPYCLEASS